MIRNKINVLEFFLECDSYGVYNISVIAPTQLIPIPITSQHSLRSNNENGNSWTQADMDTHIQIVWHTIWLLPSFRLSHFRFTQHTNREELVMSRHLQPIKFSEWIGNVNVNVTWIGWDGITFYYNNSGYLGSAINILQ